MNARAARTALATLLAGLCPQALHAQEVVGRIREIEGRAFIRPTGSTTETLLTMDRDKARPLFVGDTLRCEPGSRLIIWGVEGTRPIVCDHKKRETMTSFRRAQKKNGANPLTGEKVAERAAIQKAIETYVRPAGPRSDSSTIYSPPRRAGRALIDTFAIRWIPLPDARLALRLWDPQGNELWHALDVDGAAGQTDPEPVRAILRKERARIGSGRLTVTLTRDGIEDRVSFTLLSVADERLLQQEFAFWEREQDPVFRLIGRGATFAHLNLFVDAADEYDAALSRLPKSQDLVRTAIEAHVRTGNTRRELELRQQLLKGMN